MRARLIYENGGPRVVPTPTGYLIDCTVESPPADMNRNVWIEITKAEARELHGQLSWLLWTEAKRGDTA